MIIIIAFMWVGSDPPTPRGVIWSSAFSTSSSSDLGAADLEPARGCVMVVTADELLAASGTGGSGGWGGRGWRDPTAGMRLFQNVRKDLSLCQRGSHQLLSGGAGSSPASTHLSAYCCHGDGLKSTFRAWRVSGRSDNMVTRGRCWSGPDGLVLLVWF